MKHLWFFSGVLLFILVVLLNTPSDGQAAQDIPSGNIYAAPQTSSEGTVCCTIMIEGQEKTCAAAPGRSCEEICMQFCEMS